MVQTIGKCPECGSELKLIATDEWCCRRCMLSAFRRELMVFMPYIGSPTGKHDAYLERTTG